MGCVQPMRAWRKRRGTGVTFTRAEGWADRPVEIKCGRCLGCKRQKAQAWALRITHEASMHRSNCFLTLTIDDKHMPEDRSLDPRHWQLFAKRLRKRAGPFRHLYSGEYGSKEERPHYHACIFGLDMRRGAESFPNEAEHPLWRSAILDDIWGMGHVAIGELEYASAQYTAKYVVKSEGKEKDVERWGGRKPEYISMSRGGRGGEGGIGTSWIKKYKMDAFGDGVLSHQGILHAVPKFYEKVLTELELGAWKHRAARAIDELRQAGELTRSRLDTKEYVLQLNKNRHDREKRRLRANF